MTEEKYFDLYDEVSVFDQRGKITDILDTTTEPHLYVVTFHDTQKSYDIEARLIKKVDITECVKSFKDAVNILGNDHEFVKSLRLYEDQMHGCYNGMRDIYAYMKLRIIVAALNEGWIPEYGSEDNIAYVPVMYACDEDGRDNSTRPNVQCSRYKYGSLGGAQLAFKTSELAEYALKQFRPIFAEFYF